MDSTEKSTAMEQDAPRIVYPKARSKSLPNYDLLNEEDIAELKCSSSGSVPKGAGNCYNAQEQAAGARDTKLFDSNEPTVASNAANLMGTVDRPGVSVQSSYKAGGDRGRNGDRDVAPVIPVVKSPLPGVLKDVLNIVSGEKQAEDVGTIDGVKEQQIKRKAAAPIATSGDAKHNVALVGKAEKKAALTASSSVSNTNTFELLASDEDGEPDTDFQNKDMMSKQIVTKASNGKNAQHSENFFDSSLGRNIKENLRGMEIKSKLWTDQREYDDEELYGDAYFGYSSEEDDHESEDEEVLSAGSPSFPQFGNSMKAISSSKLNAKAQVFVPKSANQKRAASTAHTSLMQNAATITPERLQKVVEQNAATSLIEQQQQHLNTTSDQQLKATINGAKSIGQ